MAWHSQPSTALYTPSDATHFFARLAEELPPLLAADGRLFLGVDFTLVDEVRAIFAGAGWEMAGESVPPPASQKGYFSPAALLTLSYNRAASTVAPDEHGEEGPPLESERVGDNQVTF